MKTIGRLQKAADGGLVILSRRLEGLIAGLARGRKAPAHKP